MRKCSIKHRTFCHRESLRDPASILSFGIIQNKNLYVVQFQSRNFLIPFNIENAAQSFTKCQYGKFAKGPAKGPVSDAYGKNAAKTAASYPWFKGATKRPPPDEWGREGGRWVETASSSAEPSWEYRRPVGYQEGDWREDGQSKGDRWSPSWAAKGWADYRTDKGYGYGW